MKSNKLNLLLEQSRILFLLIFLSIIACTNDDPENLSQPEEDASPASKEVVITQNQFKSSAMELGQLGEYSFNGSMKINGSIEVPPEGRAEISSYYGGYVRRINLLPGQEIKKGQLLMTLENPDYVQMQQDFLEAQSLLAYLKSDFERQQTLNKENIASQKNYLKAASDYKVTLARYEGLKKKLSMLNLKPESIVPEKLSATVSLYAPISGYITEVNAVQGTFLSSSDVAVKIINTDHIHLELHIFEKNVPTLKKGQTIRFRFPDSREKSYEAEVFLIGKNIEIDRRTINVHAHLKDENQNGMLIPGMYVEAELFSSNHLSKSLPSDAVIEVSDGFFVLVKKEVTGDKMIFERREVKVGKTSNERVEILNADDFKPTDEFLTRGAFNLIH